MKKFCLMLLIILFDFIAAFGQDDSISLKTGTNINHCHIVGIDTVNLVLVYQEYGSGIEKKVPFGDLASYSWGGIINAGIPRITVTMPKNGDYSEIIYEGGPGTELVSFADNAQTGLGIMVAGTLISSSSVFIKYAGTNADLIKKRDNIKNTLIVVGAATSLVGYIVFIFSFNNARNAGNLLKENSKAKISMTENGVGLVIPINRK